MEVAYRSEGNDPISFFLINILNWAESAQIRSGLAGIGPYSLTLRPVPHISSTSIFEYCKYTARENDSFELLQLMKMSSTITSFLSLKPLIPLTSSNFAILTGSSSPAKIRCSQNPQQLNLSVLRFTLGIPGLDESYLPRYIGYGFGALLVLNHFLGADSSSITPAQLRTEALGLSLASFSAVVPFLGKFLKGATPTSQKSIPEGAEQIFAMSQNISADLKENLAWGTYVLLRNTNSISVLISVEDALCVRGYWSIPKDLSRESIPLWFQKQTQGIGLSELKDAVYLDQSADSELKQMVPEGTRSLLVQPILEARKLSTGQTEKRKGFVLLASGTAYAFTDKDKAWIAAIANKFDGTVLSSYSQNP